ncbi:hypothetical protein [Rhizobium leguminosarum]|uniref:hypothetical protein n=1 Tax=Rhizobium leguminosarum TaxID=384 RepID=UPI0010307BF1|nr:hypothetical protein [Rhizobium leguminosarum]TBG03770.1 hypothetical protein ELG82_09560 [Rhizobium leguminosarum]
MKILEIIRSALRSPDATASDLRAALAAIDLAALEAAVVAAEGNRTGLLLDYGSEAALDKADDALKTTVRERDRAIAAQVELSRRLAEAEVAEAAAALDAERTAIENEAGRIANLLATEWVEKQAWMAAVLERLSDAETAVNEFNSRAAAAGRSDRIASVETRAFPVPAHLFAGAYSIVNRTTFRAVPGAPAWGDNSSDFVV